MNDHTRGSVRRGENYGGQSRAERSQDRRGRLVDSAVRLFGTRSYEQVTVADVCADAKVSKRYFYEHFTDRENLVVEVHREQNAWLLSGAVRAAPERPSGLADLLRPAMHALTGLLHAYPQRARVIYINAPRMETRRRGVLRHDAEFLGAFLRRAGQGAGHGGGAAAHPADQLRYDRMLLALVAGMSEVIIDWISNDMADDPALLADHLTGLGLALLTPPPT